MRHQLNNGLWTGFLVGILIAINISLISIPAAAESDFDQSQFDLLNEARRDYNENVIYSASILDRFVRGNLTNENAMTATSAVFLLTSRTVDKVEKISPTDKYANYHEYTLNALTNLEDYLWLMMKYFQTNNRDYARQASDSFNMSVYYYDKGIEELVLYL